MKIGILGMPNSGKTSLFNALARENAELSCYQFSTRESNIGMVAVPDERIEKLQNIYKSKKLVPISIEFADVAGLVKGSSEGQGLGNQFLNIVRSSDIILNVVRCFENKNVAHVEKDINPVRDLEIINLELLLADLKSIENRINKGSKIRGNLSPELNKQRDFLYKIRDCLNDFENVVKLPKDNDEIKWLKEFQLLSAKEQIIVANIGENDLSNLTGSPFFGALMDYSKSKRLSLDFICAKLEHELALLDVEERKDFMEDYNLAQSSLDRMVKRCFDKLGLITFFTAGPKEVHAWEIEKGGSVLRAAGKIHSDLERGFIRSEVFACENLFKYGSEKNLRDKGLIHIEGKNYEIKDGDVLFIRFNI
ncbi:MAG: redox-regulated ATPase YchF [bacterium]